MFYCFDAKKGRLPHIHQCYLVKWVVVIVYAVCIRIIAPWGGQWEATCPPKGKCISLVHLIPQTTVLPWLVNRKLPWFTCQSTSYWSVPTLVSFTFPFLGEVKADSKLKGKVRILSCTAVLKQRPHVCVIESQESRAWGNLICSKSFRSLARNNSKCGYLGFVQVTLSGVLHQYFISFLRRP